MNEPSLKRVLVTGGAGYVGCVLVPKLLALGHEVTVYDALIFGDDGLPKENRNLSIVKGDIRDTELFAQSVAEHDAVIHLACVANDPSFELNPEISKSINFDCFRPMVEAAKEAGIQRFVYVSTSSVYGVSDAPEVTEEHPLVPLTDYNKFKGLCEPVLFEYQSPEFTTVIIRPATVCGYSPRTRLDLSVNILTNLAVNKGQITVFGGEQKRPNIHVEDVTDLYVDLLSLPDEKIAGQIFNASQKNYKIAEIASIVKEVVEEEFPERGPIDVVTTESDDKRSYHVTAQKIKDQLGYEPKYSVVDAVRGLCAAFRAGKLPNSLDDTIYFNVKRFQEIDFR